MAKTPTRKTLELLIKKVQELENQLFAQRLHIDELEGKLQRAEETIQQVKENPFGNVPIMQPYISPVPNPAPLLPPPVQQWNQNHFCSPGKMDSAGNSWCTTCGTQMTGITWTTGTGNITLCQADPQTQSITFPDGTTQTSASGVEEIDLDIIWDDNTTIG